MPREKPLMDEDLAVPPIRRWDGPIVDAHTHTRDVETSRLLFEVAAEYGIDLLLGITHVHEIERLARTFGSRYRPIVWVEHDLIHAPDRFSTHNVRLVRQARALGAVAGKFWYTPRFLAETDFRFDHPALSPVFATLAELGMGALVHIGDPDCWFATRYRDVDRYGAKADHYAQLESTLAAHPDLRIQGAHFGGDPEDLAHLRHLLDTYANYHLDTSATKWVTRELSAKPDEARRFVLDYADRLVFGSDLVAFPEAGPEDYQSRYWVHRWLWEGKGRRRSPIPDPSAPWDDGPRVEGLDLPDDVLARLYVENARRFYGLNL